jgi:hypothetical protein
MGVILGESSAVDPIAELAREMHAHSRRVAGAWRSAREYAVAVLRGEDGGIPADVKVLSGHARKIADASGCSLQDGLRGAYEMARTITNAFPDEDALARAYLTEAASTARGDLRCTGITITSMSQLGEVAGAYARAMAAGQAPAGLPEWVTQDWAAQAPQGTRAGSPAPARPSGHRPVRAGHQGARGGSRRLGGR